MKTNIVQQVWAAWNQNMKRIHWEDGIESKVEIILLFSWSDSIWEEVMEFICLDYKKTKEILKKQKKKQDKAQPALQ